MYSILTLKQSSFTDMANVLEKQEQKIKPERAKRTRLYPPTNPYALVAVALDIRPVISSMVIIQYIRTYVHTLLLYLECK